MPKFINIYDAIRNNELKGCSVPSCTNKRYRVGAFCENCGRFRWYWGHPEARAVNRKDYAHESGLVREVIKKNLDHEGIKHGIGFLNNYLKRSAEGANYFIGYKHAERLYNAGVDVKELLIEFSAIYMLSRNIHTPIKGHRHLKYLLGNKFIRFVPCPVKVRGTENRDVGEYINDNIGTLLLNISNSARKLEKPA